MYYLHSQMVACQLLLHHCLYPAEARHLVPMAVAEAGRMGSMHVVILDTAEAGEEEADTTTDLAVYLQGNGDEARPHQIESPVLVEEEAEEMAVTGEDEGGGGGSRTNAWAIWPALFDIFDTGTPE
jgi:hypothetical protein